MKVNASVLAGFAGSLVIAAAANAGFTGWSADSYSITEGADTWAVIDLFANFDSATDNLLNVFNMSISNSDGSLFYNASAPPFIPASFKPNVFGGALPPGWAADSFVTIGNDQTAASNGTSLDPGFNDANALATGVIGPGAGWFNVPPTNGQGTAGADLKVLVGRFSIVGIPASAVNLNVSGSAAFNTGQNAAGSGSFAYVPAPGALALLGLAGLAGRRRRA
jgi:MYXO-CTERM domain-containing protein